MNDKPTEKLRGRDAWAILTGPSNLALHALAAALYGATIEQQADGSVEPAITPTFDGHYDFEVDMVGTEDEPGSIVVRVRRSSK